MQSIKVPVQPALDEQWFQRLQAITGSLNAFFIMLMPETDYLAAEQMKFYAADCQVNPDLRPSHLDGSALVSATAALKKLQSEIAAKEGNTCVRIAYEGHIEEVLNNLELILASMRGDHARFMELNELLYGLPDREVYAAACSWIRQDIQDADAQTGSELARFKAAALKVLPDIRGEANILLPDPVTFKAVRDMHFAPGGFFDQLFAPESLPGTSYIEQEFGDLITRQTIRNTGSDFEIVDSTDGLWAVLSRRRKLMRPAGYRIDRDYFAGIIAHEVGSHILEEANGLRQPLRLLGLGLAGFEKGNEARAYLREQIVYPNESVFVRQASWEYILALHLSDSVAAGLAGRPYTFVELYEMVFALHRFWRQRRYPMDTNIEAEIREEAWQLAVRVMKGTDGSGGGYLKDTVYLEGSVTCWNIANVDPGMILFGDIGKFNIADPSHLELLAGLGIRP
jgi:hypothetical protein